ncbi:MAG: hypothetical protein LBN18_00295 [Dysgonamonadaceae bacterium]|jgi:hypothetical protein|nr:hypothetical protein [Dysgonamonadaceae bacterium]
MDYFRFKNKIFHGVFILFVIALVRSIVDSFLNFNSFTASDSGWQLSEFLINYEGGFYRRGLLGQLFFWGVKYLHIDLLLSVKIFSLVFLAIVCGFFIRQFRLKNYPWQLLTLCFFLGGTIFYGNWIRKDCLMMACFILIMSMYNRPNINQWAKFILINVVAIFIILTHELFCFFALPILFLLIMKDFQSKSWIRSAMMAGVCLLPSFIASLLMVILHGNQETADAIYASWNILGPENALENMPFEIAAIGWKTLPAFLFHIRNNFLYVDNKILSTPVWCLIFPTVYYIAVQFLSVFKKKNSDFSTEKQTLLSSVILFQFLCLSPVFLVLCCDYARVFFLWIASSFTVFLLTPASVLKNVFPSKYKQKVAQINLWFTRMLPPSRTLVGMLMLIIGICPACFFIKETYQTTVIYQDLYVLFEPFKLLLPYIQ